MELDGEATAGLADSAIEMRTPPRASRWLWHPWYAKVWWALILIYWGVRALSLFLPRLEPLFENALAGYLNIAFFPPTLLIALGIGFVGDYMDHYRCEWVATPEAGLRPRRAVGGFIDPYTDPLNPRSGAKYLRHLRGRS